MANTLTEVTPKLLALGLLALRERAIMPKLVNRSYDTLAGMRGSTIDVPIPSAITTRTVTPAVTWASNQDVTPTSANVTLDQWKEASFHMSDQDKQEAMDGHIPMQASEAIKALANTVDGYILGKYTGIYSTGGTAGTTPFATNISAAGSCRALLNTTLAPPDDRHVVLDVDAESAALQLSNILQFDQRGDQGGIVKGKIGEKLGMDWFLDQNVPTHTVGTAWVTGYTQVTISAAAGDTTMSVLNSTATGTIVVGDIFTVAGGTQQYVIDTAVGSVSATAVTNISFLPALATAVDTGTAITLVATHVVNLVFHRDAFAFASRPLARDTDGLGSVIQSATDPVSGLSLRLEVARQYKQTTYSYDILYGAMLTRAELACRLAG